MGRLKEADQYLSQAQWSVLKSPDCQPSLKSRLHRNLGQLATAKNQLTEAKKHFSEDVRLHIIIPPVNDIVVQW